MSLQTGFGAWLAIVVTVGLAVGTLWWAGRLFRSYRRQRRGGRLDALRNPGFIALSLGFFFLGGVVWQLLDVVARPISGPEEPPEATDTGFFPILAIAADPTIPGAVLMSAQGGLWRFDPGAAGESPDKTPDGNATAAPAQVTRQPLHLLSLTQLAQGTLLASGFGPSLAGAAEPLGLTVSEDGGQTWADMAVQGQAALRFLAAADGEGQNLYAEQVHGRNDAMPPGIYRSADGGRTWAAVPLAGLPEDMIITGLAALDPDSPILATDTGLFLSRDGGLNWTTVVATDTISALHRNWANPDQVLVYIVGEGEGLQIWHVADNTFTSLDLGFGSGDAVLQIGTDPTNPGTILAATWLADLYKTVDGGATWQPLLLKGLEP